MSIKGGKSATLLLSCISILWFLWFVVNVPVASLLNNTHGILVIWPNAGILRVRWLLVVISLVISAVSLFVASRPWSFIGCLPVVTAVMFMADFMPHSICAGFVFAGPVLVVSLILSHILEPHLDNDKEAGSLRWTLGVLFFSWVCYFLMGAYMAVSVGEHSGDEAHYLMQAKSLYEDLDLDLKNNILAGCSENEIRRLSSDLRYLHIAPNSRDGRWYSQHPHGLPILMAPLMGMGIFGKYILFGLIGALANVAMYSCARLLGAGRNTAVLTVGILGFSLFWMVYAARALPEMLGAALICWAFWAMLVRNTHPWRSVLVGGLCCGYLIHTQERFIPLALLMWGFYGLFGLSERWEWRTKIIRLGTFTIIFAAFCGVFVLSQFVMFKGGVKYSVEGTMMAYPLGMWGVIAGMEGLISVLPFYICILAGFSAWFVAGKKEDRCLGTAVLAILVTILITSCSNLIYAGGACVPGRYLLVSIPLFVGPAAVALQKTNRYARWWFLFAGGLSVALLVWELLYMHRIGKGFNLPVACLPRVHSGLLGMFYPHASFSHHVPIIPMDCLATTVYIVGCFALTFLLLKDGAGILRRSVLLIVTMILLGVGAHAAQSHREYMRTYSRGNIADWLTNAGLKNTAVFSGFKHPVNLFELSEKRYRDFDIAGTGSGITTRDLGERMKGRLVSQPRVEVNDWIGRGYRWTTLTAPYEPPSGRQVLHIRGTIDGDANVILALKEGKDLLYEAELKPDNGVVDECIIFKCGGFRGHLYILMRLGEGDATFRLEEMRWSPYDPGVTAGGEIFLPGKVSGSDN